jgi:penicillin-binding protein 1A
MMYGSMDYYRDGYIVHTTLNLEHQEAAERFMAEGLERGNREYAAISRSRNVYAVRSYLPIIDLLTLTFDLTDIREGTAGQHENRAVSRYVRTLNPVVDLAALAFGIPELKDITGHGFAQLRASIDQNVVEGALITLENETGYITAIVGGSKFDESNQLIRATQASVQPGSAFKPLYYSAAIDSRQFTTATMIYDVPMAFHNEDGTPYVPNNYGGAWRGPVLLYNVLSLSLNIPSLKIIETIGFDAAISRSAALLDVPERQLPRVFPLGLGVNSTSPLRMARGFAVFANQGRVVTPIAIREIQDRNGKVVFDVERELRQRQRRMANNGQVVSPQNAFIMTRLLEFGVTVGTLMGGTGAGAKFTYRDEEGRTYRMPVAGKTGTTQNWADAWVVGYTPYYTTAIWYGFDKPGNSLGISQTGAQLAGPVWGDYMSLIHRGLPQKNFVRPSGIVDAAVCRTSGLLLTESCQGAIFLPFLEGTVPARYCEMHGTSTSSSQSGGFSGPGSTMVDTSFLDSLMPALPSDFQPAINQPAQQRGGRNNQSNTQNNNQNNTSPLDNQVQNDDSLPVIAPPAGEDNDNEHLPQWDQLD